MFLRAQKRKKDGKTHTCWSIVENRRVPSGKVLQKTVLYLGEINSSQKAARRKRIDIISDDYSQMRQTSLFGEDNAPETVDDSQIIRLRHSLLLEKLGMRLPDQPSPRIKSTDEVQLW